mmetsp:Transcript_4121/g.11812  ORF Transcript_4121/g.11812 Transcript_4121/m.11812 type:complete len:220 (+) Transcript_4121:1735-2394(+)
MFWCSRLGGNPCFKDASPNSVPDTLRSWLGRRMCDVTEPATLASAVANGLRATEQYWYSSTFSVSSTVGMSKCSGAKWSQPRRFAVCSRGHIRQPASRELTVMTMVWTWPNTTGSASITTSSADAGSSMSTHAHVGSGMRYGRCRCGALMRSHTNAANSSSSARQYTALSISTISTKLSDASDSTPSDERMIPTVGVSWRERRPMHSGRKPRSAMPCSM